MHNYKVFCPAEDWDIFCMGSFLPRDGDELRFRQVLYKVSSTHHQVEANPGNAKNPYMVTLPVVYVSRLK